MTVATLIADARNYTIKLTDTASVALGTAIASAERVGYTQLLYNPVGLPPPPVQSLALTPPVLTGVELVLPAEPATALMFQDISALDAGVAPAFSDAAPTITLPTTPSQVAQFLAVAPGINTNIVFPEPPAALANPLIEAPTLLERGAPVAPEVLLPVFGALVPVDTTVTPTDHEARFGAAYRDAAPSTIALLSGHVDAQLTKINPRYHEQMARIESQLAAYLDGGTGLKPAVENAIYERARDKNAAEARRVRDTIYIEAAGRGFTMPTGTLLSAARQARQAGADNNARASNEITVLQAEMEQKNLQFAVTTSAGLRTAMIDASLSYHRNLVSINGQALDYAKTILSAVIETYNTAVKAFGLKLDAYKAEAVVYETRLKSAMAGIELYKVQIEALQALTNVDRAKVDVYRARIDALTSLSNVYRAQVEAVAGRASLEKLKLDLFQSQVQAYSAQVQGKNAEWQGYTAAIEGQVAKVKVFGAQVDAFGAQVQGYKATVEAKAEVVRAAALTNDARARQYSATLAGYSAVVQARGDTARTRLENQRQQVIAFQAETQAKVSNAQVQSEYYRATSNVAIENARLSIEAIVKSAGMARDYTSTLSQLHTANATIHGNLASAALSGMNTLSGELKNE